jgi:hypothetical protein
MKKLTIELTDKQYCMIKRIAKGDKRKLSDLMYLALADGLYFLYSDIALTIEKIDSDYTAKEKKQIAKNKKLESAKDWDDLGWEERQKRGFDHVSAYMSNYPIKDDFMPAFRDSLERNAIEGLKEDA